MTDNHKTVIGYLRLSIGHGSIDSDSDDLFHFELEDHTMLNIEFSNQKQKDTTPLNKKIALCISEFPNDAGYYTVCNHENYYSIITDTSSTDTPMMFGLSTKQENNLEKKHIGIFYKVSPLASEHEEAVALKEAIKRAKIVENFYKSFGYHKWDVKVKGYVFRSDCDPSPPTYCGPGVSEFIRNTDMGGFDPNYIQVIGSAPSQIGKHCGHGILGGSISSVYTHGCGVDINIHEVGHMFGMGHATSLSETGSLNEYGDNTSVMGTDQNGLNSPNLVLLGLESEEEIKIVNTNQQLLLCPIELGIHGMHENEFQNVIIQKPGAPKYHISIRKGKGFPYTPQSYREKRLYIHRVEGNQGKSIRLLPDLNPGDSRIIGNGIKIEYLEYDSETARVNILTNSSDPKPTNVPMPDGFPTHIPSTILNKNHNGLWWNKNFPGQGFDVQIKNNRLLVYWYTFNQGENSRRFYLGDSNLSDDLEEFDLYTSKDGSFTDPKAADVYVVGRGQLYFFNDTKGVFNFNTEEHGRGSIEIEALKPIEENIHNGAWYDTSRLNEGFTMQFFHDPIMDKSRCIAYWYTYGPKSSGGPFGSNRIETQRWFICDGQLSPHSDNRYTFKIFEIDGGEWLGFSETTETLVGTAKLDILTDNSMKFEYDINSDHGVSGNGVLNLTRLF